MDAFREAPEHQYIDLHYDYQKNPREFRHLLGDDWLPLRTRYMDIFGYNDRGSVRPDLCVHVPNTMNDNRLVVEIKCGQVNGFKVYHDLRKLRLYTDPNGLQFQTGVFLHINGAGHGPGSNNAELG